MRKNRQCHTCEFNGQTSSECLKCVGRKDEVLSGHGRVVLQGAFFDPVYKSPTGETRRVLQSVDPEAEEHLIKFLFSLFDLTGMELQFFRSTLRGATLTGAMKEANALARDILSKPMSRQYAYKLRCSIAKKMGQGFVDAIMGVRRRKRA